MKEPGRSGREAVQEWQKGKDPGKAKLRVVLKWPYIGGGAQSSRSVWPKMSEPGQGQEEESSFEVAEGKESRESRGEGSSEVAAAPEGAGAGGGRVTRREN